MPRLPFLHRSRRPGRPPAAVPLVLLAAVPAALLCGCLGAGLDPAHRPEPRPALDAYRLERAEARSLAGCRYDYRVFEPAGGAPATSVILGHGFLRDQDRQVGLARALANAGHRAVTLDFCNMRPWNGHHERNAADMRRLARTYGLPGRTVYAGFSAGALAALLAGADDPDALGVVALDLVDQGGLGLAAATRSPVPIVGLAGPPAACNANGSGLAAFAARPGVDDAPSDGAPSDGAPVGSPVRSVDAVPGATHCDFESPTDWLCELACGASPALGPGAGAAGAAPGSRRELVVRRTVALVDELAATAPVR